MNGSRRPIIQMFRRLCVKLALYDPNLSLRDYQTVFLPETDERVHQLELEAMRRHGEIELAPNLPLTLIKTTKSKSLVCAGFNLSTL
jgi:hypothetical protein